MAKQKHYSAAFFDHQAPDSIRSAERVVPILNDMFRPGSVVDVGCGVGGWLSVFQRNGIEDVYGLDGDWVQTEQLRIDPEKFHRIQLESPFRLDRRFDMAISLEVAEHLSEGSALGFVESLTRLAPLVVFSAALPMQGGTNHRNEQWPDFWARLFDRTGYQVFDVIRPRIWSLADVCYWYRQNMLIFVDRQDSSRMNALARIAAESPETPLNLVHPELLLATHRYFQEAGIRQLCRRAPKALATSFGRIWARLRNLA